MGRQLFALSIFIGFVALCVFIGGQPGAVRQVEPQEHFIDAINARMIVEGEVYYVEGTAVEQIHDRGWYLTFGGKFYNVNRIIKQPWPAPDARG